MPDKNKAEIINQIVSENSLQEQAKYVNKYITDNSWMKFIKYENNGVAGIDKKHYYFNFSTRQIRDKIEQDENLMQQNEVILGLSFDID